MIIIGHSLGSVVAYDSLNAAINQDLVLDGALQVKKRTRLFLTLGSPLDKTAFIFRAQTPDRQEVREALAAAMQPMIAEERHRPPWVNIYSPDDWVSGDITFYDNPDWSENSPLRVVNKKDPEACTPGISHNEYWSNALLREVLWDAVVNKDPRRGESADREDPASANALLERGALRANLPALRTEP